MVDGRSDARHGRGIGHRPRDARLVPRRLGRDDGRDDVPVRRADDRSVLADDEEAVSGCPARLRVRLSPDLDGSWLLAFGISDAGGRLLGDVLAWDHAGRWVAGGTLALAAAYELTPLKTVCLRHCRSPLGFLLGSWREGLSGAVRMGAKHGAWCVGCCWALMASLFALGVMSIAWMAFVAALIAAEKTLPWGRAVTYGTAAILLALGVLVVAVPEAIPGLTIPAEMPMQKMP